MLHLNFDQAGPGGAATDKSGLNNNGRAFGVKWTDKGKRGGAYEFTPANSFIQVFSSPSLNVRQATFAAWFKTSRADAIWRRILDKRSYSLSIAGDSQDGQAKGKLCITVGACSCLSDSAVADGAWHHAAATFDGTNLKLYVDGQLQKQAVPMHGEIAPNASELTIGMNRSTASAQERGQSFEGMIDEVMVFNRALSEAEIKTVMGAGGGTAARPAGKTFTRDQVARRLRELKDLLDKGLITQSFYERKVEECKPTE
ncbi:MAG: hypothetical protein HZA91_13875 [Verrucomicrobia bacterium]|nr:hypothetical protein [Verrucomicrobiota bacterium]